MKTAPHMMQEAVSGKAPVPMSAGKRAWGVYDIFTTADGKSLFVGVVTERQWELFTGLVGDASLQAPAFRTNNDRSRERERLIPLVQSILGRFDCATLESLCERSGLPFARVQTPSDLFDDPHLNAGGMIEETLPDGRGTRIPALPVQFGAERLGLRLPLPTPGQHNDEILGPLAPSARAPSPQGDTP